jgi:hypothetical protein
MGNRPLKKYQKRELESSSNSVGSGSSLAYSDQIEEPNFSFELLDQFPAEIINEILKYCGLNYRGIIQLYLVSKSVSRRFLERVECFKFRLSRDAKFITDDTIKLMSEVVPHHKVHTIDLSHCEQITHRCIKYLQHFTNLKVLNLTGCRSFAIMDVSYFEFLSRFAHLQELYLHNCVNEGAILRYIYPLATLKRLSLPLNSDDNLLLLLSNHLTNLVALSFEPRKYITDKGLKCLPITSSLRELALEESLFVGDCYLDTLPSFNNLTSLYLADCSFVASKLSHVTQMTNLKKLTLRFTPKYGRVLNHVRWLTQLNHLELVNCHVDTSTVHWISQLTNLTYLRYTGIMSRIYEALPNIAKLTKLKTLDISTPVKLTGGLKTLTSLTSLTDLSVSRSVTSSFDFIEALPALTNLDLSYFGIQSDPSILQQLTKHTQLRRIDLSGWSKQLIAYFQDLLDLKLLNVKIVNREPILESVNYRNKYY